MEHTKEPWEVSAFGDGLHANNIPICQFFDKCEDDYPNREANARRIVAAVNACAGIPTDDLELCPNGGLLHLAAHSNRLVEQRDELLAALEVGRKLIKLISPFEGGVTRQMDKAIASVKGGAA